LAKGHSVTNVIGRERKGYKIAKGLGEKKNRLVTMRRQNMPKNSETPWKKKKQNILFTRRSNLGGLYLTADGQKNRS